MELKPCPFCGSQSGVHILRQQCVDNGFESYVIYHSVGYCVLSDTFLCDTVYDSEEDATNAWNKRFDPSDNVNCGMTTNWRLAGDI